MRWGWKVDGKYVVLQRQKGVVSSCCFNWDWLSFCGMLFHYFLVVLVTESSSLSNSSGSSDWITKCHAPQGYCDKHWRIWLPSVRACPGEEMSNSISVRLLGGTIGISIAQAILSSVGSILE